MEEEHLLVEQGVEEGGGDGEDSVPDAVVGDPDDVLTLGVGGIACGGAEHGGGAVVERGVGGALAVERLVLAQAAEEVSGRRVRRRIPVDSRLVSTEAGACFEVGGQEATEKPVGGGRRRIIFWTLKEIIKKLTINIEISASKFLEWNVINIFHITYLCLNYFI